MEKETRFHINLYLDPSYHYQLHFLCQMLEQSEGDVLRRLIGIAHWKLTKYLKAAPVPSSHRVELGRDGEYLQSGPRPLTKVEARRRLRYFYGAFLIDESKASDLVQLANAAKVPPEQLLEEMVDFLKRQALNGGKVGTQDRGENPEPP